MFQHDLAQFMHMNIFKVMIIITRELPNNIHYSLKCEDFDCFILKFYRSKIRHYIIVQW